MSLRTRLFVWVGSLFLLAFVFSYFWENYVTKKSLLDAKANIQSEIIKLNEVKREHYESFLRIALSTEQAKINVLLDKIAENQILIKGFEPPVNESSKQTWLNSSLLVLSNKWIDFVQNTIDNELGSFINIDPTRVHLSLRFPINANLAFVAMQDLGKEDEWTGPYVGINMQLNRFLLNEAEGKKGLNQQARYALFSVEQLQNLQINDQSIQTLEEKLKTSVAFPLLIDPNGVKAYIDALIANIRQAQKYLETHKSDLPPPKNPKALEVWVNNHLEKNGQDKVPTAWSIEIEREKKLYGHSMEKATSEETIQLLNRYDEIIMAWGLSILFKTNVLGSSPADPNTPFGSARFLDQEGAGKGIFNHDLFSAKPLYHYHECSPNIIKNNREICLDSSMEVANIESLKRTFFVNTMSMKKNNRESYLTLGIDVSRILQQLSIATHEATVLVSGGNIVSVYGPEGRPNDSAVWQQLPVANIMAQTSGLVSVGNEEMFFLHMVPFPETDFHFFIFNPKDKEFALVDDLDKNANELINKISAQMRLASVVALIFVLGVLHNIARRITKPITTLAHATEHVAKGKLDDVVLPDLKTNRQDEVCTLYRTFCKMVEDLRDKEKVRGVLNKVVSREIAEEILQGSVHLGGEEREVTVFFADIRHFTHLTEKMPPQEVIELLNGCMTKISHAIDEYGGVIDKYVGDEIMALFGAPVAKEDSALKAVQSAITMVETLGEWNKERSQAGKPAIEMGFGIHTGLVVAGNMGAENRLNYTVLGSNVNLSSRLCTIAKPMQILISEQTLKSPQVSETIEVQEVSDVELKGFTEKLTVYEVKGYHKKS